MFGLIFWLAILIYVLFCFTKGNAQDTKSRNDCADRYVDHVRNGNSYSFDNNAGIYDDWRGRPRDVVTGKIAVRHHDHETGEEWVVDKRMNILRNISEQEWSRKEIEGINRGEDLVLIDNDRDGRYKRFNFVEGPIYKDVESGKYCVIREFSESYDNYYKRRDYNPAVYKTKERQWEVCREFYEIVVDVKDGHFVRFKDKDFIPKSIIPMELRIKKFNELMDQEWLEQTSYRNRIVAGRKISIYRSCFAKVYF